MHATLACLLLGTLSVVVNAVENSPAYGAIKEALPLSADVIHIGQVVVIDQDVLSIAADIALSAAAAKAATSNPVVGDATDIAGEDGEGEEEGEETQEVRIIEEGEVSVDRESGAEIVEEGGEGAAAVEEGTFAADGTDQAAVLVDQNLQQQNAIGTLTTSWSVSGTASYPIVIDTDFTFSPITLAPESSRSARPTTIPTQKPLASAVKKVKSGAPSVSSSLMYWVTLFLCLMGQYL